MNEITKVSVSIGTTVNLGNYENVKVEISVEDYVRESDLNTSEAVDRVFAFVEQKLAEKVEPYSKR